MKISFLVDASMPRQTVALAQSLGWAAEDVRDIGLGGESDQEIFNYAVQNNKVILTRDVGFANILIYPPGSHPGIVVMRVPPFYRAAQVLAVLESFLKAVTPDKIARALTVVQAERYRIRR